MQIQVTASDANNIICEVTPPVAQLITIDRGVVGNGIASIVPVTISTFQYLRITYTDGQVVDVGPLTSTAYTATAPINITGNTISLLTVPIASGGTGAVTAAAAIQNLLPSYTGNGNKRLGLNSGATALEWVADGGGTVTSVDVSGGSTGLTTSGGPITGSGTITLAGTLGIGNGGTGQTTANAAFNALVPSQTGNNGKYLTTDGTNTSWAANPLGTVTSVDASGGTTGLTFTGGPITTSGTLTLSGTLAVANGGTGITAFGTGVATALGINVGSAGAFVVNGGALGTPSSGTLTNATGLPVATGISGLGTGVATALAVNIGSAGAPVLFNGALGTPSSGTVTNLTGTASININGTVGATTPTTGAFTTLTTSSTVTLNGGTANGVAYLNGSKVLTTGSALTFDGSTLLNAGMVRATTLSVVNSTSPVNQFANFNVDSTGLDINSSYATSGSGTIRFSIIGSEQMRLTSTGLGIGTSSITPIFGTRTVQLQSSGGATSYITTGTHNAYVAATTSGVASFGTATASTIVEIAVANGTALTVDANRNVGLGVTPSAWNSSWKASEIGVAGNALVSAGANNSGVTSNAVLTAAGWRYGTTGNANFMAVGNGGGQFAWYTAPSGTAGNAITFTQVMTLDASGRLSIGSTNPPSGLFGVVQGNISGTVAQFNTVDGANGSTAIQIGGYDYAYPNTGAHIRVYRYHGSTVNSQLAFEVNGTTEAARITSDGRFLVGVTSTVTDSQSQFVSPTAGRWGSFSKGVDYAKASMLTGSSGYMDFFYYNNTTGSFAGYISIAGGVTTYATSSDGRLKENIVDAPSAIESIKNIQVRSFDWKSGVGSVEYGVIAQELYEVAPEAVAVGRDKDDGSMEIAWGFDGSKLVPRLIKAIQEQQAIIQSLTARVAALESN